MKLQIQNKHQESILAFEKMKLLLANQKIVICS